MSTLITVSVSSLHIGVQGSFTNNFIRKINGKETEVRPAASVCLGYDGPIHHIICGGNRPVYLYDIG